MTSEHVSEHMALDNPDTNMCGFLGWKYPEFFVLRNNPTHSVVMEIIKTVTFVVVAKAE